jgi:general secretion pathway protein L
MAQLVVGLDMGSQSIKVVGLERAMRGFLPVFFDEEPVPQDQDADGKLLPYPNRARGALEALKARGRLKADLVVTGLPGDLATSRVISVPLTDTKKIAATLPFELEAAVPFDMDEVIWDSLSVPKKDGDGVDVLVGLARKDSVRQFLELLSSVGVEPRYVELEALSLDQLRVAFAPPEPDEPKEPVLTPGGTVIHSGPGSLPGAIAVVDMGASRTNVAVSVGEGVLAARTILRGGQDLTRALAREFGLSVPDAEKGKLKEAYLELPDAPSVYPEQQKISNCLKAALQPLVRELRQTIQGVVAQQRARVRKVYLLGGASRIPNLDRWLARELNITVVGLLAMDKALAPVLPPPGDGGRAEVVVPQASAALAYALSGLASTRVRRINFRQGDLAFRGDYEYVLARAPQLAAGFMALALLGAFNAYARHFVISRQEAAIIQKQRDTCKAILNQNIDGADRCLAIMREKITPNAGVASAIPEKAAVDAYIQVALHMPKDVTVKVESLDVTVDKVRLKGTTDSFEAVDKIVKALEGGECFKKVEKGPARQEGTKVGWSATVDLECPAAVVEVGG